MQKSCKLLEIPPDLHLGAHIPFTLFILIISVLNQAFIPIFVERFVVIYSA